MFGPGWLLLIALAFLIAHVVWKSPLWPAVLCLILLLGLQLNPRG